MILRQFYLNCLAHASYLVGDEQSGLAAVVDPQRDIGQYLAFAEEHHLRIAHDATLRVDGKYVLDAEFVLQTEASAEETGQASDWRIVALQLQRARNWPTRMPGPGGGMPGGGMPRTPSRPLGPTP